MYIIFTCTLQKVCLVVASCIWMEGHAHFLMPKWYPLTDMPFFRPKPSAVQSYDRKRWFQEMRAWLLVFQGLPGPVLNLFQLGLALGTFNNQVLPLLLDFWLFLGRKMSDYQLWTTKTQEPRVPIMIVGEKVPFTKLKCLAGMSRMTLAYFHLYISFQTSEIFLFRGLIAVARFHILVAPSLATRMPNIWSCKPSGVTMKFSNVTCTSKTIRHVSTWQNAVKCRKN